MKTRTRTAKHINQKEKEENRWLKTKIKGLTFLIYSILILFN